MREKKIWVSLRKQGILFYMVMDIFISMTLLFVGIAILVVIHVCVVGRTFGREYNSGGTSIEAQRTIRRPSMSQDEIKKLPCFEYEMDQERENTNSGAAMAECAVCLESFKVGEKCRLLPKCKHSFHAVCVDSWLLKTGACPICRTGVESPKMTGRSSETEIELT